MTYSDVAPIFAMHCNSCHGPPNDFDWWLPAFASRENINTRTYRDLIGETDIGPTIAPGDPSNSRLYTVLLESDKNKRMPLFGSPLSDDEKDRIRQWIADGATFSEESPPFTMRVPLGLTGTAAPVEESQLDTAYEACLDTGDQRSPACESFATNLAQYKRWVAGNIIEVSCKIDSEAYVSLDYESEGRVLKERVATFKAKPDYGDAKEYRDWFTWREPPPSMSTRDFAVALTIRYWPSNRSAIFVVSVGDMPANARKISFTPNPLHGRSVGQLALWLSRPSDVRVKILRSGSHLKPRELKFPNLPSNADSPVLLDLPIAMPEKNSTRGLYTVLIDVAPTDGGDGRYSAALAVWIN